MVEVQGTYSGTGISDMSLLVPFDAVGNANILYKRKFVVIPNSLNRQPKILAGATVAGNVAFMVPADTVNSLQLVIRKLRRFVLFAEVGTKL